MAPDWNFRYKEVPVHFRVRAVRNSPRLLRLLPAELRNRIYELVLPAKDPLDFRRALPDSVMDFRHRLPALTRVNQQLRAETFAMFLSTTTFVVDIINDGGELLDLLVAWLRMLSPARVREIKAVHFVDRVEYESLACAPAWDKFAPRLLATGLRASQIHFPLCPPDPKELRILLSTPRIRYQTMRQVWAHAVFLDATVAVYLVELGSVDAPQRGLVAAHVRAAELASDIERTILAHMEWLGIGNNT